MLFNSYTFLFAFLPVVLAGCHWLVARGRRRDSVVFLVAASLVYYGWWRPDHLLLIGASIAVNFAAGRVQARAGGGRRGVLVGVLVFNLGLLGFFKYAGFAVGLVSPEASRDWGVADLGLPLAISFFTFQQIAYAVDSYRGKTADCGIWDYAAFVCFFPQLVAGPIVHYSEVVPQFRELGPRVEVSTLATGTAFLIIGLFKKVVLADNTAVYADAVFEAAAQGWEPGTFAAWGGTIAYAVQLYFDFSGYSDMAIGLGLMVGIVLPLNFDSPYKARSVIEFWRRWHMTLSRFLRDYLYIPLGGSRCSRPRRYANLMITMVLGGLWHGAGVTFLVWGGLHGLYLVANHAWRRVTAGQAWTRSPVVSGVGWAVTLASVLFAWAYFRADSVATGNAVARGLLGLNGPEGSVPVALPPGGLHEQLALVMSPWAVGWLWFGGLLIAALTLPNTQQVVQSRWQPTRWWAIACGVMLAIAVTDMGRGSVFLYWQF